MPDQANELYSTPVTHYYAISFCACTLQNTLNIKAEMNSMNIRYLFVKEY